MKILRMFFPGTFEDAQVYMGHLALFTADRDVRFVELQRLASRLELRHPAWRGVMTMAFARNDWLRGQVVEALTNNRQIASTLNDALTDVADTELVVDADAIETEGLGRFTPDADLILDTAFYGSRLYLATNDGLFDYDIDWQLLRVDRSRKRLDARCVSANAEYGAVNASCESDGLFTGYDEFGWRGHATNVDGAALVQTAPKSVRTSWLGTDLVNYEGPAEPELLVASVEEVERDEGTTYRTKVVTHFSTPTDNLAPLVADLKTQRGISRSSVQFVWNSSRAFFINTYDKGFFSAAPTAKPGKSYNFTRHGTTDGRIVGVHRSGVGWILETDFRVYALSGGTLVELLDEEPLSVRTFEGSKRFRNLIAVTVENGVHLISVLRPF